MHKALLVMHAPLDYTVGIQNAAHIFNLAKHPRSFVSLDDSDHLVSKREHVEYCGQCYCRMGGAVYLARFN